MSSLAALMVTLWAGPGQARHAQQSDGEAPPTSKPIAAPAARVEQGSDSSWQVRLEALGGYGGVTNLGASVGGVRVHGPVVGAAMAVTWSISDGIRGGVRLGCVMGWGLAGESFQRDESGAPARTDAYGVSAAFQGEVHGRWLTFRFAPGLGVLHMNTDEEPSREYPGAVTYDLTMPELTLSLGLELNLHRHVALTLSVEAGSLLVQTRGSAQGGVVVRF